MQLDRIDIALLSHLRADARISWARLAELVNLSASAVQRRVQALQRSGVIRHFSVALDDHAMGHEVRAYVQVKIAKHDKTAAKQFRAAVLRNDSVESCHKISGASDFMLCVTAADLRSFGRFLEEKILYLTGVTDATSFIVLESIKEHGQAIDNSRSDRRRARA